MFTIHSEKHRLHAPKRRVHLSFAAIQIHAKASTVVHFDREVDTAMFGVFLVAFLGNERNDHRLNKL